MGSADKYLGMGRKNHAGIGNLSQGGDTGGFYIWVGDMGDDSLNGTVTGVLQ